MNKLNTSEITNARVRPYLISEKSRANESKQSIQSTKASSTELHVNESGISQSLLRDQVFDKNVKQRLPFPIPDSIQEYDKVFNESHDNSKVFKATVFKKLDNVINFRGNLAILACGDSQTGKTFSIGSVEKRGLAYKTILELLSSSRHKNNVQLQVSIYIVQDNNIQDLLSTEFNSLKVRESKNQQIWIEDLSEAFIQNIEEFEAISRQSQSFKRKLCQKFKVTDKHSFHSDSHLVYAVEVRNTGKAESKSNFIDLVELSCFNESNLDYVNLKSLLSKLSNGNPVEKGDYAVSKLCHALKNTINSLSDVSIIAHQSPCSRNIDVTYKLLGYIAFLREKVKIHDMYNVYLHESELQGRAKADLWLIEREINSLCISKETKQQEIDELIENFKSKINKILKKILKLVEKASLPKDRSAMNSLTDKVQSVQDHLNQIHSQWDSIVCFKEKRMQLLNRKTSARSIDRSFSQRAKSPVTRMIKTNNLTSPFNNTGKYMRSARSTSQLNKTYNQSNNSFTSSDKKLSLKKNKNIKQVFKSPNKETLNSNISISQKPKNINIEFDTKDDDNSEIPNFLSASGSKNGDYDDHHNISHPMVRSPRINGSFNPNERLTAMETTNQNITSADDSMEEINMISKVKELTDSAARMDLKATPIFNMEKRLKEIKTMMNKVCAKQMNKKSEAKAMQQQLQESNTQLDKQKQLLQAEEMRNESMNGNQNSKQDELIQKHASKDVAVERLKVENQKLENDLINQNKHYEALIHSLKNESTSLESRVQRTVQENEQLQEDLISLNKELKSLQSMRNVQENKSSTFSEEVEFKNNRIKTLENRNKELAAKNASLQQQFDETLEKTNLMSKDQKQAVYDIENQSHLLTEFQAQKGKMETDYNNLKNQYEETQRKLTANRSEVTELQVELEKVMNDNNQLREDRDSLAGQADNMQGMIEEKNRMIDNLNRDVEEIHRLKDKTRMYEDISAKTEMEKNREITDLKGHIMELESKIKIRDNEIAKVNSELNFLRNKQNSTIEQLEKQTDQLEKETVRMRQEVSSKNTELSRIQNELDLKEEMVMELRTKLNTSRSMGVSDTRDRERGQSAFKESDEKERTAGRSFQDEHRDVQKERETTSASKREPTSDQKRESSNKSAREDTVVRERRLKLLDEIQSMINQHKNN